MKNKLILLIILCLISILALASCGQNSDTESGECAHEYTIADKKMPTCTEDGFTVFECSLCHTQTNVVLESKGHDFVSTFTWADDNSHASALLQCKTDSSHVYNISATIKEEVNEPTCTKVGKQTITATVTWADKDYTDIKEYNLGLGECKNTYKFTLKGDSCLDGFDMESTCQACQTVSRASFDEHVLFDMAHFKVCGGEAVVKICPCNEKIEFRKPNACLGEVDNETRTETDENGTIYTIHHSFCTRCDFETIIKTHSTTSGCYTYHHKQTSIVDGETVLYTFNEPNYEVVALHSLIYSYDGIKIDSCENGYTIKSSCRDCEYTEERTQSTHEIKFDSQKIDLASLGACGGYLNIRKCPCELSADVGYSLSCDYEYHYDLIEQNGELHTIKIYTCNECKMEFIYDEYIKDEAVYGLWRLLIDGDVKYELSLAY